MSLLDYGLCTQTVTVYHREGEMLQRLVVEGCHYAYEDCLDEHGFVRKFLLVMPGPCQRVFAGDRIYDGIGPEEVDWERFLPALLPEVYEISYVNPCCWDGELVHWEAGHKKEAL